MSSWDRFLAEWLNLPLVGGINQWALDHPVEVGTVAVFVTVLLSLLLLGTLARSFSGAAENKSATSGGSAATSMGTAAENNPGIQSNHQDQARFGEASEQQGAKAAASAGSSANFETFEKHLALSSDVLSEVGLAPMLRTTSHSEPQAANIAQASPANLYHEFLDGLSVEELLLVVRYSLLRESGEDAREAVKRISQRGTAEQRRLALSLMEEA